MTDRAALQGSLVDIRNVGTHKSVKLTIHVPEELTEHVIELFGWPTAVKPVSVALARLVDAGASNGRTADFESANEGSGPSPATKERRRWQDLSVGEQAGIRCGEFAFREFLALEDSVFQVYDLDMAADALRDRFKVASRKDIPRDTWEAFDSEYQLWCRT